MKHLDTLIEYWLKQTPFVVQYFPKLHHALKESYKTPVLLLFKTRKGTVYGMGPSITPALRALGPVFHDSLERQVAISEWATQCDLIYLGEMSVNTVRTHTDVAPHRAYKQQPGDAPWLPINFPDVTYWSWVTHEYGEVLIPRDMLIME